MKGMMFKEELFRAVVAGTKTETRRVVKPQPSASESCEKGGE